VIDLQQAQGGFQLLNLPPAGFDRAVEGLDAIVPVGKLLGEMFNALVFLREKLAHALPKPPTGITHQRHNRGIDEGAKQIVPVLEHVAVSPHEASVFRSILGRVMPGG
jgi:hypothetical protein